MPEQAELQQNLAITQPITPSSSALERPETSDAGRIVGMGWQPDLPDVRDFTLDDEFIAKNLSKKESILLLGTDQLPTEADNREYCSPIEDQGRLGSCTAQAVVGAMEYMMLRGTEERHVDGSRLFVYKVTRKLLGLTGDTGAYLRTTMQAIATFGMPPEEFHPYDIKRFEEEPTPFLYSFGHAYQAIDYTRLDPKHKSREVALENVKYAIAAGYPVVLGFSVYSSLSNAPDIPFPTRGDRLRGGHAVMAVGYDDGHEIPSGETVPSLLIRNSWGRSWGDRGYGYLPYRYVTEGLAQDFWTVLKANWIATDRFE